MAAPEGNQFALGNNGGRPPKFESAEHLQTEIDNFFNSLKPRKVTSDDNEIEGWAIPATITGLALYLGFESRQSLYDYEKNEEFSYVIKNARLRVENAYELNLHFKNPTGSIFALKNMGWKDTQEIKHNIRRGVLSNDPLEDDRANDSPAENIKP